MIIPTIVLIIITALYLVILGRGAWSLKNYARPDAIAIGEIKSGEDEFGNLFRARVNHFQHGEETTSQSGFLEFPAPDFQIVLGEGPSEGAEDALKITVKGVDVTGTMRALKSATTYPQWHLTGEIQKYADRVALVLRLKAGKKVAKSWYVERVRPVDETGKVKQGTEKSLIEKLVDDVIFEMIYELKYSEPNGERRRWEKAFGSVAAPKVKLTSARAVAAYYRAHRAFGSYYAYQSKEDLHAAVEALQELQTYLPNADTFLRLGMVLAEHRKEEEAIASYRRAINILETAAPLDQARINRTEFLIATALGQQFNPQSNHKAFSLLKSLEDRLFAELKKEWPGSSNSENVWSPGQLNAWELRAYVHAQMALGYGRYLSFLRHQKITKVLGKGAPARVALGLAEINNFNNGRITSATKQNLVRFRVKRVWLAHLNAKERAEKILAQLREHWEEKLSGQSDEGRKEEIRRRLANLKFQILLASGYSEYRLTAWLPKENEENENRKLFKRVSQESPRVTTFDLHCANAVDALQKADGLRARHYFVLMYLGLIHADPRFDDENRLEQIAGRYLSQAVELNPRAYYGFQQLAKLGRRKVARLGLVYDLKESIQEARKSAAETLKLRPADPAAHLFRAELSNMLVQLDSRSVEKTEAETGNQLEAEAIEHLRVAERLNPTVIDSDVPDPEVHWIKIIRTVPELNASASSALKKLETCADSYQKFVEAHQSAEAAAAAEADGSGSATAAQVAATEEETQRDAARNALVEFQKSSKNAEARLGKTGEQITRLLKNCEALEEHWLSEQFRYEKRFVGRKAEILNNGILNLTPRKEIDAKGMLAKPSATYLDDLGFLRERYRGMESISIPWTDSG